MYNRLEFISTIFIIFASFGKEDA